MIGDKIDESPELYETEDNLKIKDVSNLDDDINTKEDISENRVTSDKDEESDDNDIFMNKSRNRKKAILSEDEDDKDDDDDDFIVSKGENLEEKISQPGKSRIIFKNDSDSEDEYDKKDSTQNSTLSKIQYRSDIFDTEETDDEGDHNHDDESTDLKSTHNEDSGLEEEEEQEISSKNKKKPEKKQSSEKRKEELKKIHSTTQKMVRESEIVLPYHRPRQRTLMEFLSRKKSVPQFDDSSKKRKSLVMSMMDIQHLKEIEERKKDIDKFYKDDVDIEDTENDTEISNDVTVSDMNFVSKNDDVNNIAADEGSESSLMELPDLDAVQKAKDLMKDSEKIDEKENEDEEKLEQQLNEKMPMNEKVLMVEEEPSTEKDVPLKETLTVDSHSLFNGTGNKSGIENWFINSDKMDNFSCQEKNELHKDCDDDLNGKEEEKKKIEKPILFDEDSEDFRLHLNTEDFDDNNFDENSLAKCNNKESNEDAEAGSSSTKLTKDSKCVRGRTKRLSLLASKFKLDLGNLTCVTPKLSLDEGAYVELDVEAPVKKTGVDAMLERFIEHSKKAKNSPKPKNVLLGIVSKEVSATGEEKLVHSNVTVKLEEEEEDTTKCETPGARMTLLKNRLKAKMLEQREKARQRREKEKEFMDSERVYQDYHDDGLPDEETELTDKSETDYETESEPEENDVIIKDKKRKKNKYLDEEAEVDEENDDDVDNYNENGLDNGNIEDAETDTEMMEEDKSDKEEEYEEKILTQKRKSACRIIEDEDDDSYDIAYRKEDPGTESFKLCLDDDTQEMKVQSESLSKVKTKIYSISRANTEELFTSQVCEESALNSGRELNKSSSNVSIDQSFDLADSIIPAAQQPGVLSKLKNKVILDVSTSDNLLNSLTPFSNLKDASQEIFTRENSDKLECHSALNFLLTPLKTSQITSTNAESIKRSLLLDTPSKECEENPVTNLDLLGLCSGTFTTQPFAKSSTENNMDDLIGLCSGKFDARTEDSQAGERFKPTQSKTSYADTVIIEAETEKSSHEIDDIDSCLTQEQKTSTLSSSDEEENLKREKIRSKKKKKRKRILNLDLSDEEGENAEEEDKENAWSTEEEEVPMEYDENEEPVSHTEKFKGFKDAYKGGIRADFLDKEAELSGSEEGSDDEDEPDEDNDFMEQEEGDQERFDEEELRNQVGRAHLKSLIDSDKRELRLLQEIYLEDGDLHGEGRQRKFRWKNMDSQEEGTNPVSDQEEKEEEVEEEADWRKQRFEREKYLTEKNEEKEEVESSSITEEIIPSLERSSSLKLVRNLSIKRVSTSSSSNSSHSQDSLFLLQNSLKKRGSFLSRDDSTLQRLASLTKKKEDPTVGTGARQGGNFVFHTLTEEEVEKRMRDMEVKKRGRSVKPPEKKRMRIERSFFSMEETVQSESVFKHL